MAIDAHSAQLGPYAVLFHVFRVDFPSLMLGVSVNQIVTRMDKKRGALSTGYGFVEFASPSHVMEALKKMQGMELDGHVLELKFSKGLRSSSNSKQCSNAD